MTVAVNHVNRINHISLHMACIHRLRRHVGPGVLEDRVRLCTAKYTFLIENISK